MNYSDFSLMPLFCRLILLPLLLVQMVTIDARADESATDMTVAARVNGTAISGQEFKRELERIQRLKGINAKTADEAGLADLKREALENVIIRELLYQESIKQKISIDATVVEREMDQVKAQFASPGQFAENLKRIKMNEDTLREQVTRGLVIQNLIDRSVGKGVAVTDEEVKKYYEQHLEDFTRQSQVRLSHILVSNESEWPKYNKKEAGDKLSVLRKRGMAGEDFGGLAAAHSDCQSKTKGGDIGWFAPGQLTPEMEKAVALLKVGELSEIVEDRFGLHIIKVIERKAAFTTPFDDVRERVRSLVRQEKSLTMLQRYVKNLRNAARVEILLAGE